MSGDYSRVRFDPRIDLSGVLMQQGRVQLDSDWNEWVAVLDRRLRAESVDTFGVHVDTGYHRRGGGLAADAGRLQDRGRRRQNYHRSRPHVCGRAAGGESRRRHAGV